VAGAVAVAGSDTFSSAGVLMFRFAVSAEWSESPLVRGSWR
jgi:hypothetical protein